MQKRQEFNNKKRNSMRWTTKNHEWQEKLKAYLHESKENYLVNQNASCFAIGRNLISLAKSYGSKLGFSCYVVENNPLYRQEYGFKVSNDASGYNGNYLLPASEVKALCDKYNVDVEVLVKTSILEYLGPNAFEEALANNEKYGNGRISEEVLNKLNEERDQFKLKPYEDVISIPPIVIDDRVNPKKAMDIFDELDRLESMIRKYKYEEELQSEEWRSLRSRLIAERGCKCEICGGHDTLQIHHLSYEDGKKAWEYPDSNFLVLCKKCHEKLHGRRS